MRWLATLLTLLLVGGCSTFEKRWDAADVKTSSVGPGSVGSAIGSPAGRWVGHWRSGQNNHAGEVRAILEPTASLGVLAATFRSEWGGLFVHETDVNLRVDELEPGRRWRIRGASDLGIWGEYRTVGTIDGDRFEATYEAVGDTGRIEMRRAD